MQGDKLAFVSKKGEKVRVFDVSHIHKMPVNLCMLLRKTFL